MFEIQHYWSFVAAIMIFQIIPGPGTIAILNATARNGMGAGFGAVLGTLLGDFVFMLAAVAGLAAVMQANPVIFLLLQLFGAGYLCWMGVQLLLAKLRDDQETIEPAKSARFYFRRGFSVSLTNPKVILFFVAFFPLFMQPDSSAITMAAMMAHVTLLSLLYQSALVLVGNIVAQKLRSIPSVRIAATKLAGIALLGFGIKLATGTR